MAAVVVSVARWCWIRWRGGHRPRRGDAVGILVALGPIVPVALLAAALDLLMTPVLTTRAFAPDGWRAPAAIMFPSVTEFNGPLPTVAAGALAGLAASETAQLAAAVGLLVWLLTQHAPRWLRVAAWTVAAGYLAVCGGSWVFLGWSRTSETVAALLLGAAWTVLNAAIWSARHKPLRDVPIMGSG